MKKLSSLALAAMLASSPALLLSTWSAPALAEHQNNAGPTVTAVPANPGMPRITAFDVKEVERVEGGVDLDFTLWGTPGAQAVLHIDGARRDLTLTETASGVYQGSYTVSSRDKIAPDARVTGVLRRGNQVGTALLDEPLQRGWVSPVAVTTPEIANFTVRHGGDRNVGSRIEIALRGTPGGRATVRLPGARQRMLLLDEVRPGEYSTSYLVQRGDELDPEQPAVARLRVGERSVVSSLPRALAGSRVNVRYDPRDAAACVDCGRIEAVNRVEVDGDGNHVGTVAGGLLGAVIGSQFGKGDGRTAAGVAGAVGGALLGREYEKRSRRSVHFEVVVRLTNGERKVVNVNDEPALRVGDEVRLVDGVIQPRRS